MTGIALDGRVELAWQPVGGRRPATTSTAARSPTAITTAVTPAGGVAGARRSSTRPPPNGTTYYYAVRGDRARDRVGELAARPGDARARASCSTGNPSSSRTASRGSTAWKLTGRRPVAGGGIEGFATAQSINKGESIDLKVNAAAGASVQRRRLPQRLLRRRRRPPVLDDPRPHRHRAARLHVAREHDGPLRLLELVVSATITTTATVAVGRLPRCACVRNDNGADNEILFVVRDDGRALATCSTASRSPPTRPTTTTAASRSTTSTRAAPTTVSGTAARGEGLVRPPVRAAARSRHARLVHAHRLSAPSPGSSARATTSPTTSRHRPRAHGARVRDHKAYMLAAHDEYWSAGDARRRSSRRATPASTSSSRGLERGLLEDPLRERPDGGQDRVAGLLQVDRRAAAPTRAASRPARGATRPAPNTAGERAASARCTSATTTRTYFPLVVSAAQGADRVCRYTGLDTQAPGHARRRSAPSLVGWEWDARVANGVEPAGVKTLVGSPVTGEPDPGQRRDRTRPGSTTVERGRSTRRRAARSSSPPARTTGTAGSR